MDFDNIYIDELIDIREEARQTKNYKLSDKIRDFLDTKHIFVFDTKQGQTVYHQGKGTRVDLIKRLKKEKLAQKLFDAWLYSINKSIENF
ncbi:hypothetical protein [Aestuariivivens sediminis]|uniref:hypothetical protein n=1 Tax=Aestuariivivens sediminis TaxID=2913557 RepID=UPI001F59ABAC|nr:hypothetical protein [Aestuariivivens sediminis]